MAQNRCEMKLLGEEQQMAHLAAIVDSTDDAVLSKTLDGTVTSWNKGAERLYGYSAEEAVGRHVSFIVPQERLVELQEITEKIARGERVEHLETVRVAKDGRQINVSVTISPVLGASGGVAGVSSIARDISERKRLENKLRESETRYRTLVEMAPDAVVVNQAGHFVYANCAALGIYGARQLEQLQHITLVDLVHPEERDAIPALIRQVLEGEEIHQRELRLLRLDGSEVEAEISAVCIHYQGQPSIQIHARDVSLRKRAERERESALQELSLERARFETVVRQMPVGVIVVEAPSGKVIYDNEQARRISRHRDLSLDAVTDNGQPIYWIYASPLPIEEHPLARALKGETVLGEELEITRGDGTRGSVSVNATPIRDPSGQIVSAVVSFSDITERKLAAQALIDSEQRLKLALDAAEMGSCDINVATGKGVWSGRHFQLLGYEAPQSAAGEAAIEMWQSRIHPDDLERVKGELDRAKQEGTFFRSEHRIIRVDNQQEVWVNVQGRFLCDEQRAACRFIGVIYDVSEHKESEEALRRSERRFRLLTDSMPQIAWIAEPDGSIEYVNIPLQKYMGMDRYERDIKGRLAHPEQLIMDVVHPDEAEMTAKAWQQAIATGEIYQSECRLRRWDGAYRWHLSRAIPVRDETGDIIKWYGTATDIDDLREMQEKLLKSESTLKLALETTGIGIFDLDLRTGKGDWTEIAKRHYGLPPDAAADLDTLMAGVHPEDRERLQQIPKDACRLEGPEVFSAEYRTIGIEDKKLRWLTMRGRVLFDDAHRPVRLVGACLDISDIVKAEKALKDEISERLRAVEELGKQEQLLIRQGRLAAMGEMIGNIAHQWRQPLNTLALIVQELPTYYQRDLFTKEYLEASVARAMQVINYMSKTIDGFRNFFGPDKEKENFKAGEVLTRTISIVEAAFNELKLQIEVSVEEEIVISGYPNEFSQVVLNILMNAKDALLERKVPAPKIVVRLFKEGDKRVLTIADNAGGIAPEIMDRIFDPYFTTKGPDKGTGIGLFMSKTIIEKNMNGALSVRNTREGAEFRIEV